MEVDSVHSMIERKVRSVQELYTTQQYDSLMCNARKRRPYYDVELLNYKDFKNFHEVNTIDSIRPGKHKKNEPVVTDIRQIVYNGVTIQVKLDHDGQWSYLPRDVSLPDQLEEPPSLYTEELRIPEAKYVHLQEMIALGVIPREFHAFYQDLKH